MVTHDLFSSNQIRVCEQAAITDGIDALQLMQHAGLAAFNHLKQTFPDAKKWVIYCGHGNNAGDGYELARLAHQAGYKVVVNQYKQIDDLPTPACDVAQAALDAGVICHWQDDAHDIDADIIVDALLGIGIQGEVKEPLVSAISQMNESQLPIFALDIPSGLHADTGQAMGCCVKATATLTFIAMKKGLFTLDGPEHCGAISVAEIGLLKIRARQLPEAQLITAKLNRLPARPRNCHKGQFGHVLIVGGDYGMGGAVKLAAKAALRVGAGAVSIATRSGYAQTGYGDMDEVMVHGVESENQLASLIRKATVCVIGPGLGLSDWGIQLFREVMSCHIPMLIDASALRILAKVPQYDDNWILTPHPAEAADLLGCTTEDIQNDRYTAVEALQKKYGGSVILKGAGTLVRTDLSSTYVCDAGNPGMATAGMGDVLSGVLGGLMAQKLPIADAATLGVWLHATAGDYAAREGERGLIASDLMPFLRKLVNI